MKIVLIIYAASWLVLLIIFLSGKLQKNKTTTKETEPWYFYLLLFIFSPLIILAILYIFITEHKKNKERRKDKETNLRIERLMQQIKEDEERQNKVASQIYRIGFRDLPFLPEMNQVIYAENAYDEKVNRFIKDNYEEFVAEFKKRNLEFVYLPLYFNAEIEDKIRYNAPYITEYDALSSSYILDFMLRLENKPHITPSLLFYPKAIINEWVFSALYINNINAKVCDVVQQVCDGIALAREDDEVRFRRCVDNDNIYIMGDDEPEEFSVEVIEILDNLQETIKSLRLKGIALGAIHKFIDKQEPVSPLVITEDLRLFLPEYNNIEIKLSAQKKALYFLFLNHPEGIVLQHLDKYHNELINYYKQSNNGVLTPKMVESIKKLETYGNNQLHVVIARIREAFCTKFDERLARNYFISGEKGQPYCIPLDPDLIRWEE